MELNDKHAYLVAERTKMQVTVGNPRSAHLLNMAAGISTNAGNILSEFRRVAMEGQDFDMEQMLRRLGNIEFYAEGLRAALGLKRERILAHNIDYVQSLYGHIGFPDSTDAGTQQIMDGDAL